MQSCELSWDALARHLLCNTPAQDSFLWLFSSAMLHFWCSLNLTTSECVAGPMLNWNQFQLQSVASYISLVFSWNLPELRRLIFDFRLAARAADEKKITHKNSQVSSYVLRPSGVAMSFSRELNTLGWTIAYTRQVNVMIFRSSLIIDSVIIIIISPSSLSIYVRPPSIYNTLLTINLNR